MEVRGQLHAAAALLPWKNPASTCWIGNGCAPEPICMFWRSETFLVPGRNSSSHLDAVSSTRNLKTLGFGDRDSLNHLVPNGHFSGRTTPLTYRCCILYTYSTNIRTEYFKHAAYSAFFPLQNAVYFIMLPFLVPVLFTFYIQVC
jgi:hypothetical protein